MCYFVFFGVAKSKHQAFAARLTAAGCQVLATRNVDVCAVFPKGDVVSVVVHNGCSCDLYAERSVVFDEEAERSRYRKKNWSPAKIERALRGKRPQPRPAFVAFRDAFAAAVREAGSARILAHTFSGNVDEEVVKVSGTASMSIDEYLGAHGAYTPDVVYDVRGPRAGGSEATFRHG